MKSWWISPRLKAKKFFLRYFVVADAKSTASLFNTENWDPPSGSCLFIVHKSENYIEELEQGRWVKSPCASPAHQLPLLKHHSHTHTHTPLIYHVLSPTTLSKGKTGLSKSEMQPEGCDTGSKLTVYTSTHIHCHSTTHYTHTRSFLPRFKLENGEGLQLYKAEPYKGNLPCMFDIMLRRNCWHIVIIFDKRPKYLCTSIPTRNDVEHLSHLYLYLCKVLAFIWHTRLKYGGLL